MATSISSYIGHTGPYKLCAKCYDPLLNDVSMFAINMMQKKELPPISVLHHIDTDMYEIADGRKRFVCSYLLNYTHIPVTIDGRIETQKDVPMKEPDPVTVKQPQRVHKRKIDNELSRNAKRSRT
jgi:hypothetical protein